MKAEEIVLLVTLIVVLALGFYGLMTIARVGAREMTRPVVVGVP